MITHFKLNGSKKELKQLYLTGFVPRPKDTVVIDKVTYLVLRVELNVDLDCCIVWVCKLN